MALADYQDLVPQLVRDDSGKISTGDRDTAIALAVSRFSKDRPRVLVVDVTSAGTALLDLPAGWVADASELRDLEYPIGDVPPSYVRQESWRLYQAPAGFKIQLDAAIAVGEDIRARFTAPHTLDGSADTIPAKDREAVACWAAALLCDQLASNFSGQSLSTIPADTLDHGSRSKEFADRARALRNRYFNELGVDPKRSVAAGAVVNLDLRDSNGSRARLTHPSQYR